MMPPLSDGAIPFHSWLDEMITPTPPWIGSSTIPFTSFLPYARRAGKTRALEDARRMADLWSYYHPSRKEHPITDTVETLQAEVDRLFAKRDRQYRKYIATDSEIAAARKKLREAKYPAQPSATLIRFNKRFATSWTTYQFAAVRSGSAWYVTGQTGPNGVGWNTLCDFIRKDNELGLNWLPVKDPYDGLIGTSGISLNTGI